MKNYSPMVPSLNFQTKSSMNKCNSRWENKKFGNKKLNLTCNFLTVTWGCILQGYAEQYLPDARCIHEEFMDVLAEFLVVFLTKLVLSRIMMK